MAQVSSQASNLEANKMSADKSVALITGAGSGVGRATSIAFLNAGWNVVLAGRRADALAATIAKAGDKGGAALAVPTDVGNPQSVRALFDAAVARFGRLDFLFNNAGTGAPPLLLEDLSYEQWMTVVNANLTGTFLCMQQAFRVMKDQSPRGGRIVNNGSISAYAPRPNSAPYTSTKHAVSGLTRSGALDGRKYDIAVGQIDIGNAATEMTERMANGVIQPDGSMRVEPRMDVDHVAQSVLHMAGLPLESNVLFMKVMATKMPFVGRG